MENGRHAKTIALAEAVQRLRFLGSLLESDVKRYFFHEGSRREPQLRIESRLVEILDACQRVSVALDARELERRAANRPPAP